MSKLQHFKMGTLLKIKHGFPFLGEFFSSVGQYVVLTPGNFFETGGFKRTLGKEKYYTASIPYEYMCKKNDLIVAMTEQAEGLLGSTAFVPESNVYLHNQRIGLIAEDNTKVNKQFLYYLFMTKAVRKQIRDTASGTKIKHTSPERIYDVDVHIPEWSAQLKSANLLWNIDQKIALNNRIIAEVEAIAKTIYDYWFVQFDFPNAAGKPYRQSGGEMAYSETLKREIPKGWELLSLVSIESNIITGKTPSTSVEDNYNGNIPFITIGDIRGNIFITKTEQTLSNKGADTQKNKFVPKGALCVSCIASPGLIGFATQPSQTNQQINTVVCAEEQNKIYIYFALNDYFKNSFGAKIGATFANMNKDDFSSILLIQPCDDTKNDFHRLLVPAFERIKDLSTENLELTHLRDWLLPMLMNGQATVE